MSISQPSYKAMMDELQAILATMQHDDLDVDAAIVAYQRGRELVAELEAYLRTAKNKVTRHTADTANGSQE